jgi:hypothetical protein
MTVVSMIALGLVLLATGDFWLRALAGRPVPPVPPVPPVARLGFATAGGLVSLPLLALVLHLAGVLIGERSLSVGLSGLVVALGGAALARGWSVPRCARTLAAVAIPAVLALVVGGAATWAYVRMPHPPPPGYTSLALAGWAAAIDRPVDIPAAGLSVPVRVSSAGEPAAVAPLRVWIGDRPAGPDRRLEIAAETTSTVDVHVPAPPDGCPHRIEISLGPASTVFYGRGPAAC